MKRIIIVTLLSVASFSVYAQTKLTKENIKKDSTIKADIMDPAVQNANGEAPDWAALTTKIAAKYDATYADRTVTKAKIYFSYSKDWPTFTAAIVHYTDKYEPKDNLKLLNTNAGYILQNSNNKAELQRALAWSKITVEKEPGNADYKQTFDALNAKIASNQ